VRKKKRKEKKRKEKKRKEKKRKEKKRKEKKRKKKFVRLRAIFFSASMKITSKFRENEIGIIARKARTRRRRVHP